ncbi:MAG TPA: hypothetical protein DCQ50_13745, partial [Chryseobacterium sp.]|nr:hypothetical protein [Chryseobacterium sp.]
MATEFELRELSKELYKTYKSEHDAFEEGFLENLDKICDEYKNQYEAYDKNEEKKTDLKNLINSRYSDNFNKYFKYFSFGITDGKIPKKSDLCISEVTFDNFIDKPPTRLRDASRDCYVISLGDKTWYEFKKRIKKKQQVRTENEEAETQNLKIAGTTIIDQQFIEDINKTKDFSMAEFYISKQDKNGQWLGLIRGWDIRRKIYDELKNVVENCFEKERTNKVSIILHGDGGSGKSTQLRKTALELSSSNKFKVLWLNNFEEFINGNKQDNDVSGWDIIKSNPFQNYILFIEDLYRELGSNVKENYANINIFKKFLKSTQSVKNVRLVIGDRYMYVELVREYLYNDNNQFLLDSDENSYIIEQIVLKVPEWQLIVEQKEFSDKLESAPLFMLLFIIAKVSESKNFKNIDLSEPHKAFQNIIKSDLEFIANEHIGLAKAIYFWSCIYSEHKIPISYETFLEIADHYNGKDTAEISDLYKRWNADDEIFDKLKLYISKNEKEQFQFNHDILADLGLSKTNIYNWGKFGTKIKLKLLK